MQSGDAAPASRSGTSDPAGGNGTEDPTRTVETALDALVQALSRAQRCLDTIDGHDAPSPTVAGGEVGAQENRTLRLARALLARREAVELCTELAAVRARAGAMAREARETKARVRSRHGDPRVDVAGASRAAPAGTGTATERVVRRATAFIEENAARQVTAADIAAAAGVSVRRLQEVFRARRGTSPLGLLREVRLARAHAELAAADPDDGHTVAEIALRWGFSHAGRFSGMYRRAYGRHPRHTLDTPPPRS